MADPEVQRRSIGGRDVTEWRSAGGRRLARAHRRLARRTSARTADAATLAVGATVSLAAIWATTALYDAVVGSDGIERIDRPMLHAAMRLRSPALDTAAATIARVFGPVGMPIATCVAGLALSARAGDRRPLEAVVAAGAGSLLMTIGGKEVVGRHRPPLRDAIPPYEHSPSFPSGHTLNATAITAVVAYLLMLRQTSTGAQVATATGAAATAAAVGISRVLLGAHWFSDVATGWSAGAGWAGMVITADRLRRTSRRDGA